MKTAQTIEATSAENSTKNTKKGKRGNAARLAPWKWQPGQSGNPGGRPKVDLAQTIARAVFENNPELIYKAYSKLLSKGSAYGFQVVSDRAYGKLKETKEVTHTYQEVKDADLQQRIDAILADLGLAAQVDAARGTEGTESRAGAAAVETQNP